MEFYLRSNISKKDVNSMQRNIPVQETTDIGKLSKYFQKNLTYVTEIQVA